MPEAKNQDDVPREDQPYFIAATTSGMREQLRDANIPCGGLKYDLYLRLRANGLRIYNDDRGDAESEDSDESDDDEEEDESDDGEPEDGGNDDESSDDEDSDDDLVNPRRGRSSKKRKIEDDEGDIEEDVEELEPEAPNRASLIGIPPEMTLHIIRHLDARGTFNLALASPQLFLDGNVNAFLLEAEARRNAAGRNGLSLLEWVVLRVGQGVLFRLTHRGLIRRVVNAYLATYPTDSAQDRSGEARVEEIMFYLRQIGNNPILGFAVRQGEADIVQLLILLGEDVNQRVNNIAPLEEATALIGITLRQMNRLFIVFALLAAGADTTTTRNDYPVAQPPNAIVAWAGVPAEAEDRRLRITGQTTWTPADPPYDWAVVQNPRGLTIRQFLADERSSFMDRVIVALVLITTRTTRYPNFEGYNPVAPNFGG